MKQTPNRLIAGLMTSAFACTASQAATIIDNFTSGNLSAYTQYTLNDTTTDRGIAFSTSANGNVTVTSTSTAPEQVLFVKPGTSLQVGETMTLTGTFASSLTAGVVDDFGLAIATSPITSLAAGATGDVRNSQSFVEISFRNSTPRVNALYVTTGGAIIQANSVASANGAATSATLTGLYISRASATSYQVGYLTTGGSTLLTTYTYASATDLGASVGFWTDLRGTGTVSLNNAVISVIPEPSAAWLGVLGGVGLLRRRRA